MIQLSQIIGYCVGLATFSMGEQQQQPDGLHKRDNTKQLNIKMCEVHLP